MKKTKIKLTISYMVLSLMISGFFSLILYSITIREVETNFFRGQIAAKMSELPQPVRRRTLNEFHQDVMRGEIAAFRDTEMYEYIQSRLIVRLVILNAVVVVLSGIAGYGIAHMSVKPLVLAIEKQKQFIGDFSHEMKTPLTALKTRLQVDLDSPDLEKKVAEKIQKYLKSIDRMQSLSLDMLSLYTLESSSHVQKESLNLNQCITSVLENFEASVQKEQLTIVSKLKATHKIFGYPSQIQQLISIIIDNAIKYSQKNGKIVISTKNSMTGKGVEARIRDYGVGISSGDTDQVFDRFFQADLSRHQTGSGLGLSIAKQIVKNHKGSISLTSKQGKGTVVTIRL